MDSIGLRSSFAVPMSNYSPMYISVSLTKRQSHEITNIFKGQAEWAQHPYINTHTHTYIYIYRVSARIGNAVGFRSAYDDNACTPNNTRKRLFAVNGEYERN